MFRDTLRAPLVVAAALALSGCTTSEAPVYRMVVESATLDASATCADGSLPSALFAVHTDRHAGKSAPAEASLAPTWNEGVLTAFAPEWARGIGFEVAATCPEGDIVVGGARVRPGRDAFRGRTIVMGPFAALTEVRVHWERLVPVSSSGGGGIYFDGGYYEDDYGYGGTYDDGGYADDGSYDDGGYDDGCYDASCYDGDDDGGYADDGSYDGGDDGWDDGYDDGGYDDGGYDDGSGDDGSEGDWD